MKVVQIIEVEPLFSGVDYKSLGVNLIPTNIIEGAAVGVQVVTRVQEMLYPQAYYRIHK